MRDRRRLRSQAFGLEVPYGLDRVARARTVIIPGVQDPEVIVGQLVLETIRSAWRHGARLTSICTGAFVLAQSGLLDGRRATTHWLSAAAFKRRFPEVDLDPEVLFVDEGRLVTSAGALV